MGKIELFRASAMEGSETVFVRITSLCLIRYSNRETHLIILLRNHPDVINHVHRILPT
jgi:hypothetical protein